MADPPPQDRRQRQRIDVYAQASVLAGGEVHLMALRNLSSGGVYLEGTPAEYPDLEPGTEIELVIFGSEEGAGDDEELNIKCIGRIARVDPGFGDKRPPGFGVTISPVNDDERDRLMKLLIRASGYGVKKKDE